MAAPARLIPRWALIVLVILVVAFALAASVSNVLLFRVITQVDRLEHQVCMLEHRPPGCHAP